MEDAFILTVSDYLLFFLSLFCKLRLIIDMHTKDKALFNWTVYDLRIWNDDIFSQSDN